MGADFSGYATKAGLKCSDGRTITPEAFKHMDGMQVPLVWQHGHSKPENVLGHAVLEAREDGMYCYGYFNDTASAKHAKALIKHKDVKNLSIYANQLIEKMVAGGKKVLHGVIQEVSLVLSGANPGALIDYVAIRHSDGTVEEFEDEAIIHTGLEFEVLFEDEVEHNESTEEADGLEHATIQEIYDSLTDEQKNVVHYMLSIAAEQGGSAAQSAIETAEGATEGTTEGTTEGNAGEGEAEHSTTEGTTPAEGAPAEGTTEVTLTHQEGSTVTHRNVFEQNGGTTTAGERHVLSHSDIEGIVASAKRGGSLRHAVEEYALKHGIENIDVLFPDAKAVSDRPEFDKRRTEWVAGVLAGTKHLPFSRIKSLSADLTHEEARAKGYVKGNLKKEEFFGVQKRVTTPTTIYKKQKLDRDDIIDITDFDVVVWLKEEMRMMLLEELARAILISDGREVLDEDKIKDPTGTVTEGAGIRSIYNDHELYAARVYVNLLDASSNYYELFEAILKNRKLYKGSGSPTFYTTEDVLTGLLLAKDGNLRRYWSDKAQLASDLRVADIVTVEPMEDVAGLVGIIVNLTDYAVGTDKGGDVNFFDDFDIDYNQYKYLYETRLSGALTKIRSALVIVQTAAGAALVDPITAPTFVAATGVVTIPTQTGVVYKNADTDATLTAGAQAALAVGATLNVRAVPASASFYFENNIEDEWSFTRP